jgi:hypothetical protein
MGSQVLRYLRKESIDIYNRLHSIAEDVEFIQQVHDAYPNVPLLRAYLLSSSSYGFMTSNQRIYGVGHGIPTQILYSLLSFRLALYEHK